MINNFSKYFLFAQKTWEETLTFRFNFLMWRFRNVLQLLTFYFLWQAVFPQNATIGTYDKSQIITYVLAISLVRSIVFSNRSFAIGEEINSGMLSNYLIKPINYFMYWFSRDIGDKAMNIAFVIVEISLLIILLKPELFIQTNISYFLLATIAIVLAIIAYFILNALLEMIGFWTSEVWAPRFIFMIVITFLAGGLFPLDLAPKSIYTILQFLPFTYLLYFPVKIYLGQIPQDQIFAGFAILIFWSFVLVLILKYMWSKGLKVYTAYGK